MAVDKIKEKYEELVRRYRHGLGDLFDYLEDKESFLDTKDGEISTAQGNIAVLQRAAGGEIQFSTPDDYTKTDETDEDIDLEVQDSEGNVLDWFEGDLAISIAETTSGDGSAAFSGSSPFTFTNGTATVTVQLSNTWATSDTFTVTIDEQSVLGYTISSDAVQVTLDLS